MKIKKEDIEYIKDNLGRVMIGSDDISRMLIGYRVNAKTNKIKTIYVIINDASGRQHSTYNNEWRIMINESKENKTYVYSADIRHNHSFLKWTIDG